jgi:hypothetical protein
MAKMATRAAVRCASIEVLRDAVSALPPGTSTVVETTLSDLDCVCRVDITDDAATLAARLTFRSDGGDGGTWWTDFRIRLDREEPAALAAAAGSALAAHVRAQQARFHRLRAESLGASQWRAGDWSPE